MRILKNTLFLIIVLAVSCEKENINDKFDDGFNIVLNDKTIISQNDFNYYDYSSHLLYFNDDNPFAEYLKDIGDFAVYANGVKIYEGMIIPESRDDFIYSGPILQPDSNYDDYILPIISYPQMKSPGQIEQDSRNDIRIENALKEYNKFHSGLTCNISSIQFQSTTAILELTLSNNDSFNYYYINPDSMGINLYHNYTGTLFVGDPSYSFEDSGLGYGDSFPGYSGQVDIESPPFWNYWENRWLSLIKSGETKSIIISYDNFPEIPKGSYYVYFRFPGLNIHLSKEEINLENGKIWQGEIKLFKEITIE